jgi:hypothetical protein
MNTASAEDIFELQAKWPKVSTIVKHGYCPYGRRKLVQMIRDGVIDGGQLDDKNRTWFVDRLSLDQHMEKMLIGRERRLLEQKIIANIRKHGL